MSDGQFNFPWRVAVNERDEIVVTDINRKRVQIFSKGGSYLRSFGRKGNKRGYFFYQAGIECDKNGKIIVADSAVSKWLKFSVTRAFSCASSADEVFIALLLYL